MIDSGNGDDSTFVAGVFSVVLDEGTFNPSVIDLYSDGELGAVVLTGGDAATGVKEHIARISATQLVVGCCGSTMTAQFRHWTT